MNALTKPFRELFRHGRLLLQVSKNDIRARYAGSFFGIVWAVLYPVLFFGSYAFVYIFIFNASMEMMEPPEYVVLIFCGLVPFIAFQDALATGTSCVVTNASLMKNTLFPIEFVPVKTVLAGQPLQLSGLGLVLIALIAMRRITPFSLLVVFVWFMQILFNIGMVWLVSSINVVVRDLQNIVGIVTLMLMMVSPIAYPVSMVPANLRIVMYLNPLYYIISCYQDVLMYGRVPQLQSIIPFMLMSLALFIGGYHFFIRMKRVFSDNV